MKPARLQSNAKANSHAHTLVAFQATGESDRPAANELRELVGLDLKAVKSHLLKEQFQKFGDFKSPACAGRSLDGWISMTMRLKIELMQRAVSMM